MKTNNQFLLDLLSSKIDNNKKMINEIKNSLDKANEDEKLIYNHNINNKLEEIEYLNEMFIIISKQSDGIKYLKGCINYYKKADNYITYISKIDVLKELIKEYKQEYKKYYKSLKHLQIDGRFDNEIFCNIIKNKIVKYTNCNRVTRKKYSHLTAFLNELLIEMQDAKDPLKTLNNKLKLYEKYEKTEYIVINCKNNSKAKIIKDLLKEYDEYVKKTKRCI